MGQGQFEEEEAGSASVPGRKGGATGRAAGRANGEKRRSAEGTATERGRMGSMLLIHPRATLQYES